MRFALTVVAPVWLILFAVALRQWLEDHMWLRARKREREPGLNSLADAEVFVADLRTQVWASELGFGQSKPAPLEHNETDLRVPRARTTPLVASLRPAPVVPVRSEPVFASAGTPIFDELVRDLRVRRRALRMATQEVRVLFDALVEKWRCSHCTEDGCRGCPGCSCACKLVAA